MSGIVSDNVDDGSGVINAPTGGATISSSNPTITTNATLGTQWANSSTGDYYICTDATTDANVWTNVDAGQDSIQPYAFGGTVSGYQTGGYPPNSDIMNKFSFTSDGDSSDIGNLTLARHALAGVSGSDYGYACGGAPDPAKDTIDKFAFSSDGNAVDQGDLTEGNNYLAGHASETFGYTSGGLNSDPTPAAQDRIEKFTFASSANATDVANLSVARGHAFGQSSVTHGYSSYTTTVDKFVFASDGDASDVGALSDSRIQGAGQSSSTHGYSSGGYPASNVVDKYSFASEGTAGDVGNLTVARGRCSAQSSTTYGYVAGGDAPVSNVIDKFAFSSDGDSSDVGNLTGAISITTGQHF